MVTEEEIPGTLATKGNLPQALSPDSAVSASHTDREVNHSIAPEKPSEDGYNWRKYGQKNVKGNEYIRSYYKCSYPNCYVKKQVERLHDGRITDVTYLGEHGHAKFNAEPDRTVPSRPSVRVQIPDRPPLAINEGKPSDKHALATDNAQPMNVCETAIVAVPDNTLPVPVTPLSHRRDEHNDNLTPKRRKKVADGADMMLEKPGQESRLVVQTVSEVDIVNDGFRWRKYGQKMVKGNPNPRSYYRCSTAGCPVKKHVERASYDPKVVITTYEGQHEHNVPPVRTIVHQTPSPSSALMDSNGVGKPKSEENDQAPLCITYPTEHVSEDKHIPEIVTMCENEKSPSAPDVGHKTDNGDQMTEKLSSDCDADLKATEEEKVAPVEANIMPELSSTEQKDNLSGLQTAEAKPVNC